MRGLPHRVAGKEFGPLLPAVRTSGHGSLHPIHCGGRRSSPHALLTPMGNASSLSGDRILQCFPHPIAGSAARTVAGPTLQNERAEVRGLLHGVARKEFGLLVPIGSLTGHRSLYSIHGGRVGVAPTRSCSLPWGTHPLYLGAEFCNASPAPSHARRHAPWPAQLSKRNAPRCGSGVVTYFQTVLNSEQKCLPA